MVKYEIIENKLHLHVEGIDKFFALKSRLVIPLGHVTGARTDEDMVKKWWHGIKAPGSNIPGVITAGTFYQSGKRVFWDIHHPEKAVIISLDHESYDELVIETENPDSFVAELKKHIK